MSILKRHPDWQSRLAEFLVLSKDKPFVWGQNDCGLFVCDAVKVMTGVDLAEEVRGKYSTEEEAKAVLGEGLHVFAETISQRHDLPSKGWQYLNRGDVGILQSDKGFSLGLVVLDGKKLAVPGENGLQFFPVRLAKRGWGIG